MTQGVLNQTGDMDPDFYSTKHNFSGGIQSEGVDVPNNNQASLIARNETITGNKNHTGDLQRNGVDVATMDDIAGLPVVALTGGGMLTANRTNQVRDGNTGYTIPLASSTEPDIQMVIELPSRYSSGNDPEFTVSDNDGTPDTLTDSNGVDADGIIRFLGSRTPNGIRLTLTSDGVSNWSI